MKTNEPTPTEPSGIFVADVYGGKYMIRALCGRVRPDKVFVRAEEKNRTTADGVAGRSRKGREDPGNDGPFPREGGGPPRWSARRDPISDTSNVNKPRTPNEPPPNAKGNDERRESEPVLFHYAMFYRPCTVPSSHELIAFPTRLDKN